MMNKPLITRRLNGEYSTVELPDGAIETCWFPDDPNEPSRVIDLSFSGSLYKASRIHIETYEKSLK